MPVEHKFVEPARLRATLRAMAVVQILFSKRFPDSWFSLTPDGESAIALWGDFAGNNCHFLFTPAGSVLLGFDHESPMSPHATCTGIDDFRPWPGVYDSLPELLLEAIHVNPFGDEFDYREVTLCLWNETTRKMWQKGDIEYPERDYGDPDGESYLLGWLADYAEDPVGKFATVYGWEVDPDAMTELLSGDYITRECLTTLKPSCNVAELIPRLEVMGYRFA